jgi:hypothetical protein
MEYESAAVQIIRAHQAAVRARGRCVCGERRREAHYIAVPRPDGTLATFRIQRCRTCHVEFHTLRSRLALARQSYGHLYGPDDVLHRVDGSAR